MIEIVGTALNQWDTGRVVHITGIEAEYAHFANKGDSKAVIMGVVDIDAKIPDYLLQTGKQLCVYAVKDGITLESKTFSVRNRERPENYVYEDDQRNYIYELITNAENAIDGAVRAVKEAEDAVESANAAVNNANNSAENANNAASNANDAAEAANKALEGMDLNFVKTVNGVAPDENGNVEVQGGSGGSGEAGADGFSPVANVTQTASGAVITITDKSGTTTATVSNGKDGEDGYTPVKGKDYTDGQNGVSATHSWNGTTLTITSASGTSSANLKGDKGDKGDTGATGAQGPKGDTGATGPQGPQGDPGAKGDKGDKGDTGESGTSVTVKSVSESTADGGSNVVTFSDGKTVTIKNGSKGSTGSKGDKGDKGDTGATGATGAAGKDGADGLPGTPGADGNDGYTPVRGVDYWTTADKAEIEAYLATELAKRGQLKPEPAQTLADMTDTSLMYVLLDKSSADYGFIYAYKLTEKEVESGGGDYTNILPLAVNADGTPYVGNNGEKGYKTDTRLNSSKQEKAEAGMCCTGFIPVTPSSTAILRFKNITVRGKQGGYLYFFSADRSTGQGGNSTFQETLINSYDASTGVYSLTIKQDDSGDVSGLYPNSTHYFRISIGDINENTIITWNEEITEKSTEVIKEYAWASTGLAFVPADYEDRIIELEKETARNTADIATLKNGAVDTNGVDALTWIRNWDSPIYDRVPVFQLSAENPAVTSADKTVDGVYAKYDALMSANPRYITKTNMGMCSDGVTPVYRYDFREPEPHHQSGMQWSEEKPTIIIVSGIHIEWGGIYSLYYALKEITENPELDDLRRNVHFVVVPVMNPYCIVGAYSTNYGVQNANGVEIHRNFEVGFKYPGQSGYIEPGNRSHGGTAPLSEVESQYIDNLFKQYPDAALFLTCHSAQRDTRWGTGFIWASTATEYTCNLGYRLVDKLSKAWHKKYGTTWEEGCVRENNFVLADPTTYPNGVQLEAGDYRAGHAHVSSTNGTETRQATKYGIQGANVEVLDTFWVLSSTGLDSKLTTHGAEVYINYLLMYMGCYDHKDKKQYYIG